MANRYLPPQAAGASIAASMIGPQGMQPVAGGSGGPAALSGGIGELAHALMLARMRQGKPPVTAPFAPGAAPQAPPQPSPMNMDPMAGGAGPALA